MPETRKTRVQVIFNSDDYGYHSSINQGIDDVLKRGVGTSTSVMVNRPAARDAKRLNDIDHISVGLHLDLSDEGAMRFAMLASIFLWSPQMVQDAVDRQIDTFHKIMGRLPDHIDGHHHAHKHQIVFPAVKRRAQELNIPMRAVHATFVMGFFGRSITKKRAQEKISPAGLIRLLTRLDDGIYEIMCHPSVAHPDIASTGTTYLHQRPIERDTLMSEEVLIFIRQNPHIQLINWKDVPV